LKDLLKGRPTDMTTRESDATCGDQTCSLLKKGQTNQPYRNNQPQKPYRKEENE
jgi:hypothetical protein